MLKNLKESIPFCKDSNRKSVKGHRDFLIAFLIVMYILSARNGSIPSLRLIITDEATLFWDKRKISINKHSGFINVIAVEETKQPFITQLRNVN